MEEERELVPVPVKRQETKEEQYFIEEGTELPEYEPVEMPRRWYVY